MALSPNDPNSCSNVECYVTKNIKLCLTINFDTEIIQGVATLSFTTIKKKDGHLLLDILNINLKKILLNGSELSYTLTPYKVKELGSKLDITLPDSSPEFDIEIHYETTHEGSAVQFMDAKLTKSGKYPYLYSQCEATYARSLLPCQDTPFVKAPYKAEITAPAELNVLMSAKKENVVPTQGNPQMKTHYFNQPVPIPIYLLAIACGNIHGKSIGPRSTVWSEPEMLEAAAYEFAETENMLKAAEELCGPYVWGVYDLLVLPPSFPFGGMENPCLTFMTPTLLAGDRSLTSTVAHEISHSWTGNLVTNSNWEHFWLNEGHTVYLERLILEKLNNSDLREMHIQLGLTGLQNAIDSYGADHPYTQLIPPLTNGYPGDAFSRVPYEKGSLFLFHLEGIVGKPNMLKWLRKYLEEFKNKSLDSNTWKAYWLKTMKEFGVPEATLKSIDFDSWFYKTGSIPVQPKLGYVLTKACDELAEKWVAKGSDNPPNDSELKQLKQTYDSFSPKLREYFIGKLNLMSPAMSLQRVKSLTVAYKLNEVKNCDLRLEWLQLTIGCRCPDYLDNCFDFLNSNGRMKYVRPLYKSLNKWKEMQGRLVENYEKNRPLMHPLTAKMLAKDLNISK